MGVHGALKEQSEWCASSPQEGLGVTRPARSTLRRCRSSSGSLVTKIARRLRRATIGARTATPCGQRTRPPSHGVGAPHPRTCSSSANIHALTLISCILNWPMIGKTDRKLCLCTELFYVSIYCALHTEHMLLVIEPSPSFVGYD